MKIIITVMLCVSIISHAFAQKLPGVFSGLIHQHSRYTFELGQGNKLIVYARAIRDLQRFQNIDSVLLLFNKDFNVIKPSLSESNGSKSIIYKFLPNGQYQLDLYERQQAKQQFQFRTNGGEPVLLKTVQDSLTIVQSYLKNIQAKSGEVSLNERIYFCFILNNLEDVDAILKSGGINDKIRQGIQDAKNYSYHHLESGRYQFNYQKSYPKNDKESISFENVSNIKGDFLAIHQNFGLGVYQNQIMPNSQTEIAFVPNKYGNMGYTLSWRSIFFTERNDQTGRLRTRSNGFLSAGFTFYDFKYPNSLRVDTDHVLFGIYLGRQLTRSNAAFENGTWNLAMTVAARSIVKIQPEIYFNGFFKNVMPGLRIQMGF